jgi:hypothetical protein
MRILDGRRVFHQWDINQRITSDTFRVGDEIHFSTKTQDNAFVVLAYDHEGAVVADVPNILLQEHFSILAYRYTREGESSQTIESQAFTVERRAKPDGYLYTETEIQCYAALDERIKALEDADIVSEEDLAKAVEDYLKENPAGGVQFTTDRTLSLIDGVLSVNTAEEAELDNTLPITSAAVAVTVGNIAELLKTI